MKITRRHFLKGLIVTAATGVLVPSTLVESVHGASDLTPQERDVVARVLGLRQKQWSGASLPARRPAWMTIPITDERWGFGEVTLPVSDSAGGYLVPRDVRDHVLMALGHPSRVSATEHENARRVIDSWFWKGDSMQGEIWTADPPKVVHFRFTEEEIVWSSLV